MKDVKIKFLPTPPHQDIHWVPITDGRVGVPRTCWEPPAGFEKGSLNIFAAGRQTGKTLRNFADLQKQITDAFGLSPAQLGIPLWTQEKGSHRIIPFSTRHPKFIEWVDENLPYIFEFQDDDMEDQNYKDMEAWCKDNCTDMYALDYSYMGGAGTAWFKLERDAALYKLFFSDRLHFQW